MATDVLSNVTAGVRVDGRPWSVTGLIMHADEALRERAGRWGAREPARRVDAVS